MKRVIAREGLIFLCFLIVQGVCYYLRGIWEFEKILARSEVFSGKLSSAEFVARYKSCPYESFAGWVIIIYVLYLLFRFVRWAVSVLRSGNEI